MIWLYLALTPTGPAVGTIDGDTMPTPMGLLYRSPANARLQGPLRTERSPPDSCRYCHLRPSDVSTGGKICLRCCDFCGKPGAAPIKPCSSAAETAGPDTEDLVSLRSLARAGFWAPSFCGLRHAWTQGAEVVPLHLPRHHGGTIGTRYEGTRKAELPLVLELLMASLLLIISESNQDILRVLLHAPESCSQCHVFGLHSPVTRLLHHMRRRMSQDNAQGGQF